MTEREAYAALGWPEDGVVNKFILPISGSEANDWHAYRCLNENCPAPFSGVGVGYYLEREPNCPNCDTPYTEIVQTSKATYEYKK
jgi:hypothetical protein